MVISVDLIKQIAKAMRIYEFNFIVILIFTVGILASCNNKPIKVEEVVPTNTNKPIESTDTDKKQVKKTILFFGNSLTAGYGLEEQESFPSLIQKRIDSLGFNYRVINGGLSGETTAGGKGRIDWVMRQKINVFVLELGANDMLRGLDIKETRKNLEDILQRVKSRYPDVKLIIAGMIAPPNMGIDYVNEFQSIFSDLANEYKTGLIPFLLKGLEGRSDLTIGDGKHPNAEGQKIVMENVWKVLQSYID